MYGSCIGVVGGMCALVLKACQYVFSSVKACHNHAAIYFCPVAFSVLFLLTNYSSAYQMPYKMNGRDTFCCLCLFVVIFELEPLTSTSIYPLSSSLIYPPTPPLPFLMAVQSDPPLAQSWPITPHPNQGAG